MASDMWTSYAVIASEAKQFSRRAHYAVDCFASLAMTGEAHHWS
jgi:hypothetical protein